MEGFHGPRYCDKGGLRERKADAAPRLCGPFSEVFLLTLTRATSSESEMIKKEVVTFFFRPFRIKIWKLVLVTRCKRTVVLCLLQKPSDLAGTSQFASLGLNVHICKVGTIIIFTANRSFGSDRERANSTFPWWWPLVPHSAVSGHASTWAGDQLPAEVCPAPRCGTPSRCGCTTRSLQ